MVFVQDLQGQTQVYNLSGDIQTSELKRQIYERTAISPDFQTLIYQGSVLEDGQVLSAELMEESTLYLTLGLLGGKKGKKKNYTTKKKNKHKHKSTKLSTLKYYSIDKDNKVVRARMVCNNCGPAYFWDRSYSRIPRNENSSIHASIL
jgi:small subunit ribosomal protein S27Ae